MSEKIVLNEWVVYNGDRFNKPTKGEWKSGNGKTGDAECVPFINGKC